MLALLSINRTMRLSGPAIAVLSRKKGRAKPNARAAITRQRSKSSHKSSSLLLRVTRGGVGLRNISELNSLRWRVLRRIR